MAGIAVDRIADDVAVTIGEVDDFGAIGEQIADDAAVAGTWIGYVGPDAIIGIIIEHTISDRDHGAGIILINSGIVVVRDIATLHQGAGTKPNPCVVILRPDVEDLCVSTRAKDCIVPALQGAIADLHVIVS